MPRIASEGASSYHGRNPSISTMKSPMIRLCTIALLALASVSLSLAQGYSVSGLEYDQKYINVVVENLSQDALAAGITKGALQEKCVNRLRMMGANPDSDNAILPYLYLNVNVGKSDKNYLFTAKLELRRLVVYDNTGMMTGKGETYAMHAPTWSRSTLGDFESDNTFVMKAVDAFLDDFVKEFQKANPKFKATPAKAPAKPPAKKKK